MKDLKDQLHLELDKKENQEEVFEEPENELVQEEEKQVFYNSEFELDKSAKIHGSPIFFEEEIPLDTYKSFETILVWSKLKVAKNNISSDNLVNSKTFRTWAEQFLIHPLLEPE